MNPELEGVASIQLVVEKMDGETTTGALRVRGELGLDEEDRFVSCLRSLMDGEGDRVLLDLSDVRYVSSSYVRHIAAAMVEARGSGRAMVVRATKRVARLLELGGLGKLGEIEIAG